MKLKIYLDTSVISHLEQPEKPAEMADTLALWELLKQGAYDVFISDVVLRELERNETAKRDRLIAHLREINYTVLEQTGEVVALTDIYENNGILPKRSVDDRFHIAYSSVYRCDVLVSLNFKHLSNVTTMNKVRVVNEHDGYRGVLIVPPSLLLSGGMENESEN